jgi:CheY-like chemotaxis protein
MPPKRILCVDDDAETCEVLTVMLGVAGLAVVSAPGVAEALGLMEGERFGLFIIDSGLPGVSGLTLCEQIRAADGDTPIVIFSGYAHESEIEAGVRAGANAYIVKPDVWELVPTVKRLLLEASRLGSA